MVLHHKGGIVSFKCLHFGLRGETPFGLYGNNKFTLTKKLIVPD